MSEPYRPGRFSWRHLDQEQAARLWAELIEWVEWFRRRYPVSTLIPPCWYRHGAMVEELTAAMAAHKMAYEAPEGHYSWSPASWHYQVYSPLLPRLKSLNADFASCDSARCGVQLIEPTLMDGVDEWIAGDVARRPEPEPDSIAARPPASGGAPEVLDAARVVDLLDAGDAEPEDPSDEFGPVLYNGARWEWSDDHDGYIRAT
ncbi:hypothetical protein P9990_27055 (plasmid) [Prescottella equi]|uniref:hypothetical protein n=1 Tax=Rhodococcus hoagii TaxID=43767 RepID=UPI0025751F77|nr:hypothetical protein [Prescottella equi]WJJ14703.1 hypothetical protein P9990_27055 [Prescottella equi]